MNDKIVLFVVFGLIFIAGFIAGRLSSKKSYRKPVGTLCINYNDPNKELLALRLSVGLDELEKMSDILIMIDVDCDQKSDPKISQGKNS